MIYTINYTIHCIRSSRLISYSRNICVRPQEKGIRDKVVTADTGISLRCKKVLWYNIGTAKTRERKGKNREKPTTVGLPRCPDLNLIIGIVRIALNTDSGVAARLAMLLLFIKDAPPHFGENNIWEPGARCCTISGSSIDCETSTEYVISPNIFL